MIVWWLPLWCPRCHRGGKWNAGARASPSTGKDLKQLSSQTQDKELYIYTLCIYVCACVGVCVRKVNTCLMVFQHRKQMIAHIDASWFQWLPRTWMKRWESRESVSLYNWNCHTNEDNEGLRWLEMVIWVIWDLEVLNMLNHWDNCMRMLNDGPSSGAGWEDQ